MAAELTGADDVTTELVALELRATALPDTLSPILAFFELFDGSIVDCFAA